MTLPSCPDPSFQDKQPQRSHSKSDERLLEFPDPYSGYGVLVPCQKKSNFFLNRPGTANTGIPELRVFCKVDMTMVISGSPCTHKLSGAYLEFEKSI